MLRQFTVGVMVAAAISTLQAADVTLTATGQVTVYGGAPQADGAVRAGLGQVLPRFIDNGDGSSTDQLTGLVWVQDCNLMASRDPGFDADGTAGDGWVTWSHALDYAAYLNAASYLGHDDWRLPNKIELESVANLEAFGDLDWLTGATYPFYVGTPFSNVGSYIWSSTTDASDTGNAWQQATWGGGSASVDKISTEGQAWMVRGSSDRVWRSGQTVSYHAGDDGDLEMGVPWPSPRFTNHGDGTVTDNLTGLMWIRDAKTPGPVGCLTDQDFRTLIWYTDENNPGLENANDYVDCLNSISYLGHDDWRLPNRTEMRSLVDHSQASPALPAVHPFLNLQSSYYWTASDFFGNSGTMSDEVFYVLLSSGEYGVDNKLNSRFVWPVRGGMTGVASSTLADPDPVTSAPLFFATTDIGSSIDKVVTVSSVGTSPLAFGQLSLATGTEYAIVGDSCSWQVIDPGSSCQVTLRFAPQTTGARTDYVYLRSNTDIGWHKQVSLFGYGTISDTIFSDDFETGGSSAWTSTLP